MTAKKILIVDDDYDLIQGITIRLASMGYLTVSANDGYMAVKMAREEKPDLILLDLGLPVGDGFSVMERIQKLPLEKCPPVIVLSARDPEKNMEKSLANGAVAFFQKPANNNELLETIGRVLESNV